MDRYYVERFLEDHRQDIPGHALEVRNRADKRSLVGERFDGHRILDRYGVPGTITNELEIQDVISSYHHGAGGER